jgi:lysine-ketoglutarate reductase/saccharopine dehydrogenase-like protein (TIGR00300 family)
MLSPNERDNDTNTQEIEVEGHLIDSMILTKIFDIIMDYRGDFEVLEFSIGKHKTDYSYAKLLVKADTHEHLNQMLRELFRSGAVTPNNIEVQLVPALHDMTLPDDFYSTSNHPTTIFYRGNWIPVENIMMDKQIVVDPVTSHAYCKPIRQIKKDDLIVVGQLGIKIKPPERPREGVGIFEFMTSRASSEKPSISIVKKVAEDLHTAKLQGEKIVVVGGPAIVHTGAAPSLARLIQLEYVQAILSGNALAVHDVEYALFGTSLGMNITTGALTQGNRNHIVAVNEVLKAGSLQSLVSRRVLTQGIFYQCVKQDIPFTLAGSIRDDGPIPDVISDTIIAQQHYNRLLDKASIVIMLATMLHAIAVGNMLPSDVKVICVDINPAVVTKLIDRGTAHAIGIVSDIGTFLPLLVNELEILEDVTI